MMLYRLQTLSSMLPPLVCHLQGVAMSSTNRLFILKIESYEGRDTHLLCGDGRQDFLYAVGCIDSEGNAELLDYGYRTFHEASRAWPEATLHRKRPNLGR